jgi:prepilin-type processing-associated H-X9-DG protein
VFELPGDKKPAPGLTHYLSFLGKGAIFEGKRGIRITDITDGTSNTIMVAEAATGVPWTKPDDLPFDPDGALPKLGGAFPGGQNVLFCDGSVRFLRAMIDPKVLRALITRNGGEVIPGDF